MPGSWPLIVVKMRLETWPLVVGEVCEAWVLASCSCLIYNLQFCASRSLQVCGCEAWVPASCCRHVEAWVLAPCRQ